MHDLLYYFPRDYVDLSSPFTVASAPFEDQCAIKAVLVSKSGEQRIRRGLSIFKLKAVDEEANHLEITMFNTKFLVDKLQVGEEYIFYGKSDGALLNRKMASPVVYLAKTQQAILPIYPQTSGINSELIRKNIRQCLSELPPLDDPINEDIRVKYNIGEINTSLENIHFPSSMESAEFARNRFIFEELLTLSCSLFFLRNESKKTVVTPLPKADLSSFYASLPYKPTSAQLRAISEVTSDFSAPILMNRLVQGDVGSGKTLVAAAAIYAVVKANKQTALMVPTEILAEQHFSTLKNLLEPFEINVALLTGSTKASQRRKILESLENGSIDLCIGTHALISEKVVYKNLALVITDEQHRFGVAQRMALSQKSKDVHVLVMSATPIPRTLSLIIYGDLSVSIIDEMPPGRKPVDTLLIGAAKLPRAFGFIRDNLSAGNQAYIVCPLIEQGEVDTGLRPAVEYSRHLAGGEFKEFSVGLLHGKMKPSEKESVMYDFKNGKIDVLVSTTVVEVGVDVPNATIMLIENAERFGLSQLHQLRGRVGRGKDKSYCILVSDAHGEVSKNRLNAMKTISDGFKLAEYDLKLRGPGDFFGYRQHGLPALKVANLADDITLLKKAQSCAEDILKTDPTLSEPKHKTLNEHVNKMIEVIGERPN